MPDTTLNWISARAKAFDINDLTLKHNLTFSNYDTALQAAEQGLGLALAMLPIENLLLERKLLINPFELTSKYPLSLYAVWTRGLSL